MFDPLLQVNDWLRAYCNKNRSLLVDAYIALVDHEAKLAVEYDSGDGVHLNGNGYRAMGEYIASEVEDLLVPGATIACLGDSLTEGYPGHFVGAGETARWRPYPAYLEREGVTILNLGRCGDTTDGLLRRFHNEVKVHDPKPDHCIVHGGINDLFLDQSVEWVTGNLVDVYKACNREGVTPIAVTLLPISEGLFG